MNPAREAILARARGALGGATGVPEIPREYLGAGAGGEGDPAELLAGRLRDYGAGVRSCGRQQLEAVLGEVAEAHAARRLAAPAALPWRPCGVKLVGDDPPLAPEALDGLDGAITGCALAIAQTGTIILDGGPLSGRRVLSLVPDLHLCVVERVVARVPDAVELLEREGAHRRPLTWISGPSATSDIGFERVEGVHGPRRLEVILVRDSGAAKRGSEPPHPAP